MEIEPLKPDFYGWEMLYKSVERVILRKMDVLIALTHFLLLKQARLLCLGLGDSDILYPHEVGQELLPDGWNHDSDKYALRYIGGFELFLLSAKKTDDGLVVTLLDVTKQKTATITLDAEKMVDKIKGTITDLVPNAPYIAEQIRRELIDPIKPRGTNEMMTQTTLDDTEKCQGSDEDNLVREFKCFRLNDPKTFCYKCNAPPHPNV